MKLVGGVGSLDFASQKVANDIGGRQLWPSVEKDVEKIKGALYVEDNPC
ncbi:hypothetical protein NLK61_06865 [Pseudomonas fuscovaginae UPB0736]|uniref:Uncharacterized protein n=1 Tax=Pseudomonas asplenii TaxID=53407 RepID=A0A1H6NGZ3_9PSED|nr:hypothetical protein [Pseudomonas fuscovaginae]UUQ66357.1 hypothetical protein NLK61_06865 [Pseudomonas fuscovaginae UPB0736]SEI12558.1 hypothetical protein SAMN05216581_2487 [Pseudomonas fuscovaginae]